MGGNEISINQSQVLTEIGGITSAGDSLEIGKVGSYSSSQSAALDEFVTTYEMMQTALADYVTLLQKDLTVIADAVAQMNELDTLNSQNISTINPLTNE